MMPLFCEAHRRTRRDLIWEFEGTGRRHTTYSSLGVGAADRRFRCSPCRDPPPGAGSAAGGQIEGQDIVVLDATALSDAIKTRQVSCVEVMNACLDQIARLNTKVNAIVALQDRDALLKQAEEKHAPTRARRVPGMVARLPTAHQGPGNDQGDRHHDGLAHLPPMCLRPTVISTLLSACARRPVTRRAG
jgi:hypothetical protein